MGGSERRWPGLAVIVVCLAMIASSALQAQDGRRRGNAKGNRAGWGEGGPGNRRNQRDETGAGPRQGMALEKLDADGDGAIGEDEFRGPKKLFKRLDANQDGKVDAEEVKAFREQMRDRVRQGQPMMDPETAIDAMDADGDGVIGQDEFKGPKGLFKFIDKNKDGKVDAGELEKARDQIRQRMRQGGPLADPKEIMETLDENGDGAISDEEFPGPPQLFERIDKDGNGSLSADELKAAQEAMHGKPAKHHLFDHFDANKDGKLSKDEFPTIDQIFAKLDKDGDGCLSPEELVALPERPRGRGAGAGQGGRRGWGRGGPEQQPGGPRGQQQGRPPFPQGARGRGPARRGDQAPPE